MSTGLEIVRPFERFPVVMCPGCAIAMTLRELRSGRVEMLPQNICNRENRPSKVSFILGSRG